MHAIRRRVLGLALLAAGVPAGPATAHVGHKRPSPSPSASVAPAAGFESPAPPSAAAAAGAVADTGRPAGLWDRLSWRDVVVHHPHNKIVHFPLALGLAAAALFIASRRWPAYLPAGRALVLVAAVMAVGAYFTGQAQEEPFEDSALHEVVELHETMGIAAGVTLWLGVALTAWPAGRRWLWAYGLVLAVVLAATGALGGLLSHSEL